MLTPDPSVLPITVWPDGPVASGLIAGVTGLMSAVQDVGAGVIIGIAFVIFVLALIVTAVGLRS